jgi:hypothetical protein
MFILTLKFVLFIKANLLITPLVSKHKRKEEKIYIYKECFGHSLLFFFLKIYIKKYLQILPFLISLTLSLDLFIIFY